MNDTNINNETQFNFDFVKSVARIACYDDFKAAPRVTVIEPAPTDEFIMNLATATYEQSKMLGGKIPFTIIKEVSENFIHARFQEMTISIYDEGNTIRFADQGPGINDKDKVKMPGYSSAVEPMKQYIRGVGSGLPIVRDYFEEKHGSVTIDDNVQSGAVVTISLKRSNEDGREMVEDREIPTHAPRYDNTVQTGVAPELPPYQQQGFTASQNLNQAPNYNQQPSYQQTYQQPVYQQPAYQQNNYQPPQPFAYQNQQPIMMGNGGRAPMYAPMPAIPTISDKGKQCLKALMNGALGVSELNELTQIPNSSVHYELKKLEEAGLVEVTVGKKRVLTQAAWNILDFI